MRNWIYKFLLCWNGDKGCNPYKLQPYGKCPVQMDGILSDGSHYYFRARHSGVTIDIDETEDKVLSFSSKFHRRLEYGPENGELAGWIENEDAIRIATLWINEYFILKS